MGKDVGFWGAGIRGPEFGLWGVGLIWVVRGQENAA